MLSKQIERIEELRHGLNSLRKLDKTEQARFNEQFMLAFTHHSTAIEGNCLTQEETETVLVRGETIDKPIKDHLEVIGHKDAVSLMWELAEQGTPISEEVIKQLHAPVLLTDRYSAGVYRERSVSIIGACHRPPKPLDIPIKMRQLVADYPSYKNTMHIINATAEFHLRFEGVHPFIDGNGRLGRLLLNLELIKAGYLPIVIRYENRHEYYQCFNSFYGEPQSSDDMAQLIARCEIAELERLTAFIANY